MTDQKPEFEPGELGDLELGVPGDAEPLPEEELEEPTLVNSLSEQDEDEDEEDE